MIINIIINIITIISNIKDNNIIILVLYFIYILQQYS